MAADDVMT